MYAKVLSAVFLSAYIIPRTLAAPRRTPTFDFTAFKQADIITRDVAIIGGGSGGTYSAISLKDKGKSVIVIEKKNRIGGHTETYIDPATGTPIDIGVVIFHNLQLVKDYFARLNVSLTTYSGGGDPSQVSVNYDFRTGQEVNVTSPSQAEVGAALEKYMQQLLKYPRLNDGMFLPNPVPDELVLPFGEYVKKYGIEAVIPTMFNFNPGLGDILTVPTVEQMRVFGLSLVQTIQTGFLTTAHHNNSELYTAAQNELLAAQSLLLQSEVTSALRCDGNDGVQLVVETPQGSKLVKAKKLLITIPPRLEFLAPFVPTTQEISVFSKLIDAGYYTSIVKNTGFADNLSIANFAQDTPYNLPELPGIYGVQATAVSGFKLAFYGTPRSPLTYPLSDSEVQANIISSIKKIQQANPDKFQQTNPEFEVYSSHAPFYLQFRPEDTKAGYYDKLYALQGLNNTYWTGATFRAQDSTDIWRYTETEVLPALLAGL